MKQQVKDTHIYFPVKVLAEIKKLAARNRRTVSAEMVIAAERYIATSGEAGQCVIIRQMEEIKK